MENKEEMFQFLMPIGDWSGDGHGRCKYFLVRSNKTAKEVYKVDEQIKSVTGIDLETICDEEYEQTIWDYQKEELESAGFDTSQLTVYEYDDEKFNMTPVVLVELWIFLLMKTDPNLQLDIIPVETLHVSNFVGYGVV